MASRVERHRIISVISENRGENHYKESLMEMEKG